jgi:hypothetical protein
MSFPSFRNPADPDIEWLYVSSNMKFHFNTEALDITA